MAASAEVVSFRGAFPEFRDEAKYADEAVQFWFGLSGNLFNQQRWGRILGYGQQLFVAHNLALGAQALKGVPGQVQGPLTSGSVDKVSYARNPGLVMDPKNGHWNLTTYGLRYLQLVAMIGAGPVQVGAPPGAGPQDSNSSAGWPGPWQSIIPNPS